MKKLSRMEFFKMFITVFTLVGLGRIVAACSDNKDSTDNGGGGGGNTPQPDCLNAGTTVSISANHGHQLTVSKAAVAAGVQQTYDIQGSAAHNHTVTITAEDFADLAANQSIIKTSSAAGHTHTVTVSCALA